jgi:V/A-type H+-transporting ATPase subunit C
MNLLDIIFNPNNYPFWILIIAIIAGIIAVISRPFSTYVKFVYPNAKFEAIGNPYITEKEISRISDNKNLADFKDTLNSSKDYQVSGESVNDIQHSLDKNFISSINMMQNDSSKKMKDFYNVFIEKLDIFLIKNAIKRKLKDNKIDENIIDKAVLDKTKLILKKIIDAEKENLNEFLKEYGFNKGIIKLLSSEDFDYLELDTAIDKFIIEKIKAVNVPYKCDKPKQLLINNMIDILNIKNVLRAKHLGYDEESIKKLLIGEGQELASWKLKEISEADSVPQVITSLEGTSYYDSLKNAIEEYTNEDSVQYFENALDSHFLKLVRDISTQNYVSIGPTLRFILSKEYEIKNLKIIAKGISEGFSTEIIKPLLVLEANV